MSFHPDIIRGAFDPATFARGERYAMDGMVRRIDVEGDRLVGEVSGTGRSVYAQRIAIKPGYGGMHVDGYCSCPVARNCKHVVAVLLAAQYVADQPSGDRQARGGPVPTAQWLAQLASANRTVEVPAVRSGTRVIYALMPDERAGAVNLYLCNGRVYVNGKLGTANPVSDLRALRNAPPAHVLPEDRLAIDMYMLARDTSPFSVDLKPAGKLPGQLLRLLLDEGNLWWADSRTALKAGDATPIRRGPPRNVTFGWHAVGTEDTGVCIRCLFEDGQRVEHVFPTEPLFYLHDGQLGELLLPESVRRIPAPLLLTLLEQSPVLDPAECADVTRQMIELGLDTLLPPPLKLRERDDIVPVPCLMLGSTRLDRGAWIDYAQPGFDYDGTYVPYGGPAVFRSITDDGIEMVARNVAAEQAAADVLDEMGFVPCQRSRTMRELGQLTLHTQEQWLAFTQYGVAILRAAGWDILFSDEFRYNLLQVDDWYADVADEAKAGNGWFDLELGIIVAGKRQPLVPLLVQLIRNAPDHFDPAALARHPDTSMLLVQLPDGGRVALPWGRVKPILAVLGELYFRDDLDGILRLPLIDAARLAELEAAAQLHWMGGERLRRLGRRLSEFGGVVDVAPPAGLRASLRDYQREGLAWMQFLREYDFAGILADDMGLGKTVQTLAHILTEKEAGRLDAPALVVVPTSLVGNWCAEAARFAPGLRVLALRGKERLAQFDRIASADLVLTTYALLPRDEEELLRYRFHLLILDESQYIKNSRAKATQTAQLIRARHRLCLTGTPLQNHLGELWSQFHFLMPGLLGDMKTFNHRFRKPIEQGGDTVRSDFLTRRVKPFMLRRTKDKVARELPPKTEIVLPIELGSVQRDLYETVRVALDKKIRDEIGRKGVARSQIVILDALLKLRQVCCDPRLVKRVGVPKNAGSAKLEALMDLVETLLSEGRKLLIFSQFTSMLELIAAELRSRAFDYVTLTGDTEDRTTPVNAFQQGDVPVFLISLKAGGVGLNLTAADIVIHYDPWWNPAAENQATDRAWRIGQDKPVFVYKLIAQGTLEEKIQEMQRRKGALADAVMGEGGRLNMQLTQDDLQAIFAPL
jgi:superfamily II DNA or RNA helicase